MLIYLFLRFSCASLRLTSNTLCILAPRNKSNVRYFSFTFFSSYKANMRRERHKIQKYGLSKHRTAITATKNKIVVYHPIDFFMRLCAVYSTCIECDRVDGINKEIMIKWKEVTQHEKRIYAVNKFEFVVSAHAQNLSSGIHFDSIFSFDRMVYQTES